MMIMINCKRKHLNNLKNMFFLVNMNELDICCTKNNNFEEVFWKKETVVCLLDGLVSLLNDFCKNKLFQDTSSKL